MKAVKQCRFQQAVEWLKEIRPVTGAVSDASAGFEPPSTERQAPLQQESVALSSSGNPPFKGTSEKYYVIVRHAVAPDGQRFLVNVASDETTGGAA